MRFKDSPYISDEDVTDPLESRLFYELSYSYRCAPISRQDLVIKAWNELKQFILDNYTPKSE